jgi:hypothetical protein
MNAAELIFQIDMWKIATDRKRLGHWCATVPCVQQSVRIYYEKGGDPLTIHPKYRRPCAQSAQSFLLVQHQSDRPTIDSRRQGHLHAQTGVNRGCPRIDITHDHCFCFRR